MYIHFHNSDEKKIASQRELVDHLLNDTGSDDEMSDEKRIKMDNRIMAKLKSGKNFRRKNWSIFKEQIQSCMRRR